MKDGMIGKGTWCNSDQTINKETLKIGIPDIIARHGIKHASTMQLIDELQKRKKESRLTDDEADALGRLNH